MPEVDKELAMRVSDLGFDLVEADWGGTATRPVLRVRIDVAEARAEQGGVGLEDCASVSRGLESWLDQLAAMPETYVLEVSSPGLDRPLTRPGDWARFAGKRVAVRGKRVLAGNSKRLEGELIGLFRDEDGTEWVRLRGSAGEEVDVPKGEISRANVVFEWK